MSSCRCDSLLGPQWRRSGGCAPSDGLPRASRHRPPPAPRRVCSPPPPSRRAEPTAPCPLRVASTTVSLHTPRSQMVAEEHGLKMSEVFKSATAAATPGAATAAAASPSPVAASAGASAEDDLEERLRRLRS